MDIRFVKAAEIERPKWDGCVHYAANGNVFGYSWFLNHVAKEWDALIEGDYQSVFPLVWRKGLVRGKELYQPHLMRELGIYSVNLLSEPRIRNFLDAIPEEYRLIDIHLNERNMPPKESGFEVIKKTNHQLLLGDPYEILAERFSEAIRSQIALAETDGLIPASSLKPETIAGFYKKHTADRRALNQKFHALQRIMYNVLHRGWGFASGVYNDRQDLLAVNFFIYSHGRALSLAPLVSPEGREKGALPFLFDLILRSHAGRPLILDFNTEGPDELATGLGAVETPYFRLRRNERLLGIF